MNPEPTPDEIRQFFRRLSGNEQKILQAIYYLDLEGTPTTAENISHEAMIDRSTVFRNLKRLHENAYVEHRLTKKGRACVDYALTAQAATIIPAQVELHNRYDEPEQHPSTTSQASRNAPMVAKRDGLTAQNATPVARCNSVPARWEHNVQPNPNKRLDSVKPSRLDTIREIGKDHEDHCYKYARSLAKQSAEALNDVHSEGLHIAVWYAALVHDKITGTKDTVEALFTILNMLVIELNKPNRINVGKAWTARTRELLSSRGAALRNLRSERPAA